MLFKVSLLPFFFSNWVGDTNFFVMHSSVRRNRRTNSSSCKGVYGLYSVRRCGLVTGNDKCGTKHSWDLSHCLLCRMSECFAPCQEKGWGTGMVVSVREERNIYSSGFERYGTLHLWSTLQLEFITTLNIPVPSRVGGLKPWQSQHWSITCSILMLC